MKMEAAPGDELMGLLAGIGGIAAVVWIVVIVIVGLFWLVMAIWVGFDASSKGQPGFPWFVLALCLTPVGLAVWLVVRAFVPGSSGGQLT
jgi:hypothetical protein